VRSVLVSDIPADLAVVFDGRPDADVDGGEHCAFGNHCTTSCYVVSNIKGVMLLLKLCCVEGDHKLSY
jgi:hypothetical protein